MVTCIEILVFVLISILDDRVLLVFANRAQDVVLLCVDPVVVLEQINLVRFVTLLAFRLDFARLPSVLRLDLTLCQLEVGYRVAV